MTVTPAVFTPDQRGSLLAFYRKWAETDKQYHFALTAGSQLAPLAGLLAAGYLDSVYNPASAIQRFAISAKGAAALDLPYPPVADEGTQPPPAPIPPRPETITTSSGVTVDTETGEILPGDGRPVDAETEAEAAVIEALMQQIDAAEAAAADGFDSAEIDALNAFAYAAESGVQDAYHAPDAVLASVNASENLARRGLFDQYAADDDTAPKLYRINAAGLKALDEIDAAEIPDFDEPINGDQISAVVDDFAAATAHAVKSVAEMVKETTDKELAALRARIDTLTKVNAQQSVMLSEAAQPRSRAIEIKTIKQKLNQPELTAAADQELADLLNAGWTILNFADHFDRGIESNSDFRRITLQRIAPAAPVQPQPEAVRRDAFADTIEALDLPESEPEREPVPVTHAHATDRRAHARVQRRISKRTPPPAPTSPRDPFRTVLTPRQSLADALITPERFPLSNRIRTEGAAATVASTFARAMTAGQQAYDAAMTAAAERRAATSTPFALLPATSA